MILSVEIVILRVKIEKYCKIANVLGKNQTKMEKSRVAESRLQQFVSKSFMYSLSIFLSLF